MPNLMKALLFGTAGIPHFARGKTTQEAIPLIKEHGLDAMELEFVRSINIRPEKAPSVKEAKEKSGMLLTCHAPYFINLNSQEPPKLAASIKRIVDSAKVASLCGAWSVTFHPGFYQKLSKGETYKNTFNALKKIVKQIKDENVDIWIRPETTGKASQFGDIEELLALSQEFDKVMPCIDFSHLHARSNGKYNSKKEFTQILDMVEEKLGKRGLDNMHIHVAGIAYGEKGEKHHLNLNESDFKYKELLRALRTYKVKGILISESPNIEKDALLMKKEFHK